MREATARVHGAGRLRVAVALAALAGLASMLPAGCRRQPVDPAADLTTAVADIEAGRATTPVIGAAAPDGSAEVRFLARRDGEREPRIVSDVTGWGEHPDGTFDATVGRMTRIGQSEWHTLSVRVAGGARIEYLIAYALTDYRIDPHNPRRVGPPPASEFVTPGYEPPRELEDPPLLPAGRLAEHDIDSRALGGQRRAIVYTPPACGEGAACPLAVVLDMRAEPMSRVIDWLIAHRAIEPIVAVFVEPTMRGAERPREEAMRAFLGREVPAWASSRCPVSGRAGDRAILAISFGARDALDVAVHSRGAYGRLGLLIPGRRIGRGDLDAIAAGPNPRLRVAILAGRYDQANVNTARTLRDALRAAGHGVEYAEVPEGHSPRTWLNNLRAVLVGLFGSGPGWPP